MNRLNKKNYEIAFTEVYEILQYLDEESYKKIPKNIIDSIEKNMNKEYVFFYNKELPFSEQIMLDETKAILFNLYRDYLTTAERRKKIIDYQKEERRIYKKNN